MPPVAVVGQNRGRDGGRRRPTSTSVLQQDVRGQLAKTGQILDAGRHDLVDRKLKSPRAGVAQLDEVRVLDAGDGAGPVCRSAAEYVCNIEYLMPGDACFTSNSEKKIISLSSFTTT